MAGLVLTGGFYFWRASDVKLRIDTARIFDQDIIYMQDGSVMRGWVLGEDPDNIWVETQEGAFTLPRSACMRVEKDVFLKFMRKAT